MMSAEVFEAFLFSSLRPPRLCVKILVSNLEQFLNFPMTGINERERSAGGTW
jgi:hypothetical protein